MCVVCSADADDTDREEVNTDTMLEAFRV